MGDLPGSPRVAPLFCFSSLFIFFLFILSSKKPSYFRNDATFRPCGATPPTALFRKAPRVLPGVPKGLKTMGAFLELQISLFEPLSGPFSNTYQNTDSDSVSSDVVIAILSA